MYNEEGNKFKSETESKYNYFIICLQENSRGQLLGHEVY